MDPFLTDDQELFRETTRSFLEHEMPIAAVRALGDHEAGFDRDWWRRGAQLGWTSLLVPESDGGGSLSGEGLVDLAIVAGEMGRMVSPGPLVPTNVVAAAVAGHGTAEQRAAVLPGIVSGDLVAAWGPGGLDGTRGSAVLWPEIASGPDGVVVSGRAAPVEAAGVADWLLVAGRADAGPTQVLLPGATPGVAVTPMGGVDLVRRFGAVDFDSVRLPADAVLGRPGEAGDALERQLQIAVALQCAETAAATERVLEMTLEYAADRYSFGRPLASYQALKHRFADLKTATEACLGVAAAAVRAVQDRSDDAAETVSAAAAYVGEHATDVMQDCVQLHGGIALTWEHDLHLYLRRAMLNRGICGTPSEHRERVAALLGM